MNNNNTTTIILKSSNFTCIMFSIATLYALTEILVVIIFTIKLIKKQNQYSISFNNLKKTGYSIERPNNHLYKIPHLYQYHNHEINFKRNSLFLSKNESLNLIKNNLFIKFNLNTISTKL
jgi:hypothetical protein